MADAAITECPNCKRLAAYVGQLKALVLRLQARVQALEAEIARLRRDSSNSHKPPSSDIVKPKRSRPRGRKKRRIGGQPGHARHQRAPFEPDQIDETRLHGLQQCPDCGGELQPGRGPVRIIQQVELVEKPVVVTEHRAAPYWCAHCRKVHYGELPAEVRAAGLVGARLTALVAWLKGGAHASYTTIQALLRDVLGVQLSRGQLVRLVRKASRALDPAYEQLYGALGSQARLNVDETGHKDCGRNLWTWCFRAPDYTVFRIAQTRGSQVLFETLGREFDGVLGCDYFSAYRKYMGEVSAQVQFCLAHLIRDVKFLTTLDARTSRYGTRLLERLRALFGVIHRRESMEPERFQRALERERREIMRAARHPPWTRPARNMAQRFRRDGGAYFRFITTPGVEPTNNLAEQALRFVVIDRRMTQGTRGKAGRSWCERIWTVSATCRQHGRSAFQFLHHALDAHFTGRPAPSLLAA
jgi:transposase